MKRRVIVGTAGHIDHGKTRLVEALTGIDCDRWSEEKERGITIDLGFAHLERGDVQVGFVDVPGHEKFLHNALAGLGGIRIVLLVVAADEGVKPQTREHLAICRLLEIPAALVALTKVDLVTEDILELARLEVAELLEETPFAGADMLPVSSVTGQGVEELETRLLELAELHHADAAPGGRARLPIDRAFQLKGLGTVVTGTLTSGEIGKGDTLELSPGGGTARVRSVQVHGEGRERAVAGERTALQVTASHPEELRRGCQLSAPESLGRSTSVVGSFALLPEAPKPLKGSIQARFHLLSSEVHARVRPLGGPIAPGESGAVEVRLAAPVAAVRGDHFIVRRASPALTLGGGRILDPSWRRRRGAALAEAIEGLSGDAAGALVVWAREEGAAGLEATAAARRLGLEVDRVEELLDALRRDQKLLEIPATSARPKRWIVPAAYARLSEKTGRLLERYFARERLAKGMPKAELVERVLPKRASALSDVYLEWLEKQGVLTLDGNRVNLPGRSASLSDEESRLAKALLSRYTAAGLQPPPPSELARELGAKPQIADGVVDYLCQEGKLARLPGGLLIATAAIDGLAGELRATGWEKFKVPAFKERFGLTRKWAIPILEHLDSIGVTRRLGDERMIVAPRL